MTRAPEGHHLGRRVRHTPGNMARRAAELQAYVNAERRQLTRRLVEVHRDVRALEVEARAIESRLAELDKADDLLAGEV